MAEPHIAHQDFHQSFDDRFILRMFRARRDHGRGELTGQLRVAGVQVWIIQVAFEHTLFQTIRYGHMRDAAVKGEHSPVGAEPIAAFHVLSRPGEQQLTEAQARYKHIGFADLAGLHLDPLERIAGVVHFHALAGIKLARRDGGLPVLRELPVKLFPEV